MKECPVCGSRPTRVCPRCGGEGYNEDSNFRCDNCDATGEVPIEPQPDKCVACGHDPWATPGEREWEGRMDDADRDYEEDRDE